MIRRVKRRRIYERDGYRCHYCGTGLTYRAATLDHKHPRSKGGTDADHNLVTACDPCNVAKGDMLYERFIGAVDPEREEWSRITRDRLTLA